MYFLKLFQFAREILERINSIKPALFFPGGTEM